MMKIYERLPSNPWFKTHFSRQQNCWSFRCSWCIASRYCSNYIFIFDLTRGFNGLGKDNYKTRRETFNFCDLVLLLFEVWLTVIPKTRCLSRSFRGMFAWHDMTLMDGMPFINGLLTVQRTYVCYCLNMDTCITLSTEQSGEQITIQSNLYTTWQIAWINDKQNRSYLAIGVNSVIVWYTFIT